MRVNQSGSDLVLTVHGENDSQEVVTLHRYYYRGGTNYQLDSIVFADGTEWDNAKLNAVLNNTGPEAFSDSSIADENTAITFGFSELLSNDSDADGDSLSISAVSNAVNGSATIDNTAQTVTFTPTADYFGPARFDYTVSDGHGGRATATVELDVSEVSDPVDPVETVSLIDSVFSTTQSVPQAHSLIDNALQTAASGDGAFIAEGGMVAIEAEHYHEQGNGEAWQANDMTGQSGDGVVSTADAGSAYATVDTANSPRLDYAVNFLQTGTYYVWVRGFAPNGAADSVHIGLDGEQYDQSQQISYFNPLNTFAWSNERYVSGRPAATIEVTTAGVHTLNAWVREDGFVLDKVVLTQDADYVPVGEGPVESAQSGSGTGDVFYEVMEADWSQVATDLYGTEAVVDELQALYGTALSVGDRLTSLPATLTDDDATEDVPAFYSIPAGASWESIALSVYGTEAVASQLADDLTSKGYALTDVAIPQSAFAENIITGTDGVDNLAGTAEDDVLNAFAGNDVLNGGQGSDTYLFDDGFDQDVINNTDAEAGSIDIARFTSASTDQLWFSRDENNLQITVAGTDDQVTINNWYTDVDAQLDSIQTSSSALLNNQVEQLVSAMSSYNVPSGAGNVIPQDVQDDLQTVLAQTWQNT